MHARNTVVVPSNQTQNVVSKDLVFVVVYVVDARNVQSHAGEEGLPTRDWVGANDGMNGAEVEVSVQRRTAGRHDFVAARFRCGFEDGLGACGGKRFEEGLHGGREAVVSGGTNCQRGQDRKEVARREEIWTVSGGEPERTVHNQKPRVYRPLKGVCLAYGGS